MENKVGDDSFLQPWRRIFYGNSKNRSSQLYRLKNFNNCLEYFLEHMFFEIFMPEN
jgi:hypothetical protein